MTEEKLKYLLNRLEADEYVDLVAMPKLVEFAENKDFESNNVKEYIQEQVKIYNLDDYSGLVLGCTHFPFFKKVLSENFPKDIQIIDGSKGVANRLRDVLVKKDLLGNNNLSIEYYYSGKSVEKSEELNNLLNK